MTTTAIQKLIPGLIAVAFLTSTYLHARETVLRTGQRFQHYRIYFTFAAPLDLRYDVLREGNARLLIARDVRQARLVIVSRTIRITDAEELGSVQGQFLGCDESLRLDEPSGRIRCSAVHRGIPLQRMLHWEQGGGLLHLLMATTQKEDTEILDRLEASVDYQGGFFYPDDGL
jgi:hypothetical protein